MERILALGCVVAFGGLLAGLILGWLINLLSRITVVPGTLGMIGASLVGVVDSRLEYRLLPTRAHGGNRVISNACRAESFERNGTPRLTVKQGWSDGGKC
jgi:hypothetical protein